MKRALVGRAVVGGSGYGDCIVKFCSAGEDQAPAQPAPCGPAFCDHWKLAAAAGNARAPWLGRDSGREFAC